MTLLIATLKEQSGRKRKPKVKNLVSGSKLEH